MSSTEALREAIAQLPRADNVQPGDTVRLEDVYTVRSHRSALDPNRPLVVGNRGMGKSFWAHALTNPQILERATNDFQFAALRNTNVVFGFNGSERNDPIAPTPMMLEGASQLASPISVWRAVLARAAARELGESLPESFVQVVEWVEADPERYAQLVTRADDMLESRGRRLLLLFDALDRLATEWAKTRSLLQGLLQLALSTQSFRCLRVKLFLRLDQFSDRRLFEFPDASKIQNTHVSLRWEHADLYGLLFHRLRNTQDFRDLEVDCARATPDIVKALAGEFMGAGKKRGVVFTWLPTHLSDALQQISPRTFLTVWRVAAERASAGAVTAVDHHGILDGVREASQDRLAELSEDYPWVEVALAPMRNQFVPIEQHALASLWVEGDTVTRVRETSTKTDRPVNVPVISAEASGESDLLLALAAIGVVGIRQNGKVDVPDIFRVEAGIKRRGGVPPPARAKETR